jgi:hypothetical protein
MPLGFDVISDLNLDPDETFDFSGKASSLYCLIPGNVSGDMRCVRQTLLHLAQFYQGVFYSPGNLEYSGVTNIDGRTKELAKICRTIKNVALLHNHVVVIDGVAVLGANCHYGDFKRGQTVDIADLKREVQLFEDISYLGGTIERLQLYQDVKKIVVLTNAVPGQALFFGQEPEDAIAPLYPDICLNNDTEHKITHWVYGSYETTTDTTIGDVRYVNNAYGKRKPYWPMRINV